MGRLIDRGRRERARAARGERRELLLATAREVFGSRPPSEVSLDDLSRRAQVPESTARLVYASVEELFLDLVDRDLRTWVEALEARLQTDAGGRGREGVRAALVEELAARPLLLRLLGHLQGVLESSVDVTVATGFLSRQYQRLLRIGERLEERWPALEAGQGSRLLWRLWRAVGGIAGFARPTGALAVALVDQDLASLRVDAGVELDELVDRLLPPRVDPGQKR